jgi:hypothetical protein
MSSAEIAHHLVNAERIRVSQEEEFRNRLLAIESRFTGNPTYNQLITDLRWCVEQLKGDN